ncbi:transcription factor GHD7 [Diospyros lotus]|uniref:transcription factor GHD7 n=1 Tax=Diospyros lotus TaxID=55363 RepID=UPI00224D7FDC|nr:transcription factor GHD7 [Diospyros lotus]
MSSIPHFHSDHIFCNEFCEFPNPLSGGSTGGAPPMWVDQSLPIFDNGALDVVPQQPDFTSFSMTPFLEHFGVSDMAVPVLPELKAGLPDNISGSRSFDSASGYYRDVCELGEEYCNGFVQDFHSVYPASNDNWGFQVSTQVPVLEETSMKVGKYSVEERKDRILRYLRKRNQRNFNKTIKYACRKTLADKRVRVRGRFARNNEPCEGEAATKKNNNLYEDIEFCNNETVKIDHDREDWLQDAIASLMCLP